MTQIAIFHSVLGVRPGVLDARDRLEAAGHQVTVVDQFDGRVFDDYEEASAFTDSIGFPALMQAAVEKTAHLPDGFATMGFSNGGGMAEFVATQRQVSRVLLLAGLLPIEVLGVDAWPSGTPVQAHAMEADPFDDRPTVEGFAESLRSAGAEVELFWYPGEGHLFTDPSLPAEHDAAATQQVWERALRFMRS